jgi:3-oxoacyl-[acyl-carrier protein] reductase
MHSRYDLAERVAIVTGANHGIGAATARALAACGARVLVSYLRISDAVHSGMPEIYRCNRAETGDPVIAAIRSAGGRAVAWEADLGDPETPQQLFDLAESELGSVDILINNASGWVADTFVDRDRDEAPGLKLARVSSATFDRQFCVDARGGALMISEFARRHLKRNGEWGRIVGLTSGGPFGFPGEVSYGAAKAALENYTMSAAFELAPFGVTANMVHPPVTDTGWVNDSVRERVKQHAELLHIAAPEEVAGVITYLCSDEARLVTANRIHLR